jgi:hypothetical protein
MELENMIENCRATKTMKENERDNRRRRRRTKRKANFTGKKGESRGLEGGETQKHEN